MKQLDLADFGFTQDANGGVTVIKDGKPILAFAGPNTNKNINALIVGLMAVNPGLNPTFVTKSLIAQRYSKSTTAVDHWGKVGAVPGLISVASRDSGERGRAPILAMPEALLDQIQVRPRGNPTFNTGENPAFKRKNGTVKTR